MVVPEPHWRLRSAWCQVGNLRLPGESLPGHFIVFLRTARSLITFPHLLQMLCIPAVLHKAAEPYSTSPKRAHFLPPRQLSASCTHPSQGEGNGPALKDVPAELTAGDTALPLTRVSGTACGSGCCVCRKAGLHTAKVQANSGQQRWFPTQWHHGHFGHFWVSP